MKRTIVLTVLLLIASPAMAAQKGTWGGTTSEGAPAYNTLKTGQVYWFAADCPAGQARRVVGGSPTVKRQTGPCQAHKE
jgi:hypothetical protein